MTGSARSREQALERPTCNFQDFARENLERRDAGLDLLPGSSLADAESAAVWLNRKLALSAFMKPKLIRLSHARRRPQLFQDFTLPFQDRILTPEPLQPCMKIKWCLARLVDITC